MQFQALDTRRVPAWRRHDEWTDDDPVALGREGQVSDAMPSPGRRLRGVESVKGTQQDQIGWALPARDGVLAVAQGKLGLIQGQRPHPNPLEARLPQRAGQAIGERVWTADKHPRFAPESSREEIDALRPWIGHRAQPTQQGEQLVDDVWWVTEIGCDIMKLGERPGPVQALENGDLTFRQPAQHEGLGADPQLHLVDAATQRRATRMQPGLAGTRRSIRSGTSLRHAANLPQQGPGPSASSTGPRMPECACREVPDG